MQHITKPATPTNNSCLHGPLFIAKNAGDYHAQKQPRVWQLRGPDKQVVQIFTLDRTSTCYNNWIIIKSAHLKSSVCEAIAIALHAPLKLHWPKSSINLFYVICAFGDFCRVFAVLAVEKRSTSDTCHYSGYRTHEPYQWYCTPPTIP